MPLSNTHHAGLTPKRFLGLRITAVVLGCMLLISLWATWHANQVNLPRYCNNPVATLMFLEQVLTKKEPAGEGSRRPYIIAAKILFLLPQGPDEAIPEYLDRVHGYIQETCQ